MRVFAAMSACLLVGLAGCGGGSGSNPFGSLGSLSSAGSAGSFGSGPASSSEPEEEGERREIRVAADDSILLNTVDTAIVEPARRGSILRVSTTTPTQGYHSARLAPVGGGAVSENGVLIYELRAIPPEEVEATGPARTRQIIVATFIPEDLRQQARVVQVRSRGRIIELVP